MLATYKVCIQFLPALSCVGRSIVSSATEGSSARVDSCASTVSRPAQILLTLLSEPNFRRSVRQSHLTAPFCSQPLSAPRLWMRGCALACATLGRSGHGQPGDLGPWQPDVLASAHRVATGPLERRLGGLCRGSGRLSRHGAAHLDDSCGERRSSWWAHCDRLVLVAPGRLRGHE